MSIYTDVRVKKPKRSKKDLSFTSILTTRFGALTPILCEEVYPNETWKETPQILCRMTPLIAPLMSKMEIRVDYFFVPNRILWSDWEEFITRGIDGLQELEAPMVALKNLTPYNGSLADYLNFSTEPYSETTPLPQGYDEPVSVLPFAAYQKIYQDWYVDENLQPNAVERFEFPLTKEELEQNATQMSFLQSRGWKKDYFTAALPWAQRGPEVSMSTDIVGNGGRIGELFDNTVRVTRYSKDTPVEYGITESIVAKQIDYPDELSNDMAVGMDISNVFEEGSLVGTVDKRVLSTEGKIAGLEGEGFTVNEFRRLVRLQEWFERNARAGGRYIEQILSHFGKRVPDYRLDRSEYIGGVQNQFTFGEVLQTSSNDESTGQALGSYAGRGISLVGGRIKKYRVDEHGWIFGILSIRPTRNAYYQGIPRQYSRKTALEYMWPTFTSLGEQAIKNKEIYLGDSDEETRNGDFGYIPRYAELYNNTDQIHGEARNTLDFWHTARKFSSLPRLNAELISIRYSGDQLNRVFAFNDSTVIPDWDSSNDHFVLEVKQTIKAKRCLPVNPVPTL